MTSVLSAKFLYSRVEFEKNDEKNICFVGRSNAGKSSLLNMLCGQKKLAKTSNTPGRTKLINYFEYEIKSDLFCDKNVNDEKYREVCSIKKVTIVDLPGYGFASVSKQERAEWDKMITQYLQNANIALCVVIVDSRHIPTELDITMTKFLYQCQIPFVVVGTKCDKISNVQKNNAKSQISSTLKLGKDNIIIASSETKENKDSILNAIATSIL